METTEKHQDNDIESVAQAKNKKNLKRQIEDDEIDLAYLAGEILQRKKVLLYTTIAAFCIGLFIAVVSPNEYTASIVLMPESETSSGGGSSRILQQIGGFAGVSFGGSNTGLNKNLYPDITQSTPFYLAVMSEEQHFPTLDTTMSLQHYFTVVKGPTFTDYVRQYTLGLPKIIINLPIQALNSLKSSTSTPKAVTTSNTAEAKGQDSTAQVPVTNEYEAISLSRSQLKVMSELNDRITTTITEPNGTVEVSAKMPDPLVAAKTTELAVNYLTKYITEYRIEKVQEDLDFIEKQYEEKEKRYNKAQENLAQLRDRNSYLATESARIELERAQTEFNLAFSLYQSVAQQLEQARIKVQEETPVFKVLEPVQIPLSKSEPKQELIIIVSLLGGLALGGMIILVQIIFSNIKSKLNENAR